MKKISIEFKEISHMECADLILASRAVFCMDGEEITPIKNEVDFITVVSSGLTTYKQVRKK